MIYTKNDLIKRYNDMIKKRNTHLDEANAAALEGLTIHGLIARKLRYCFFGGSILGCVDANETREYEANDCVSKVINKFLSYSEDDKYVNLSDPDSFDHPGVGIEFPLRYLYNNGSGELSVRMDSLFLADGKAYIFDYKHGKDDVGPVDDDVRMGYATVVYAKYSNTYKIDSVRIALYQPNGEDKAKPPFRGISKTYDDLAKFTRNEYGFTLAKRKQ